MPNSRGGMPGSRNPACIGKQSYLPPKSPGPATPQSYLDYNFNRCTNLMGIPRPREGNKHQRTSSEGILIDEQPSWLDDLLNEPETHIKRGAHRRSSSDSSAYVDVSSFSSNLENLPYDGFNNQIAMSKPSWGPVDFDRPKGLQHPHSIEASSSRMPQNRGKELCLDTLNYLSSSHPSVKNKFMHPGPISTLKDEASTSTEQDIEESAQDAKGSFEKRVDCHATQTQSEMETKRVKQQFAQRSRVRKLHYIAELERNVQALQADGLEISAEIEFLSQQNLILSLENTALKQRFDSLSQEHLIKCFEHDMLEREIARLRAFFHHQQQQWQQQQQRPHQKPNPNHSRSNSRDLDSQFSNLSLKNKDTITWSST